MESYEKKQRLERESAVESKEKREEEMTEEAKAAATRERAEYLVKEVKSSTQQMQNIMLHMQAVLQALHKLESQLQLTPTENPSSIAEDTKRVEKLQQKINEHKQELREMRGDLIVILESEKSADTEAEHTQKQAQKILEEVMQEIEV